MFSVANKLFTTSKLFVFVYKCLKYMDNRDVIGNEAILGTEIVGTNTDGNYILLLKLLDFW